MSFPETSFNNRNHPLSPTYARLCEKLVPGEGKCETVEGELLRAASRIYHDYYNNGFGNNWSGAYNYIDKHFGLKSPERKVLKPYARGKIRKRSETNYTAQDPVAVALEGILEYIVQYAATKEKTLTPNTEDMLDLSERSTW